MWPSCRKRDLSAMIGGVIERVLDEFAQRVGGCVESPRAVEFLLREATEISQVRFVVVRPRFAEGGEVRIVAGCWPGHKVAGLPEAEPSALAPEDVDERAFE